MTQLHGYIIVYHYVMNTQVKLIAGYQSQKHFKHIY
jgi:hypothetical protein